MGGIVRAVLDRAARLFVNPKPLGPATKILASVEPWFPTLIELT
jgi:hypothetical protein